MAQEDQNQRQSNINTCAAAGGNKSYKRLKQKKIPQRGLGVAQLEKIRLEEQQKKDAAVAAAARFSSSATISQTGSSYLSVPLPNYNQSHSSSSIPLPPPSPTGLSSPNSRFRPAPLIPNIDIDIPNSNSVQFLSRANVGGVDIGWSPISAASHGNVPKLWNCEYSLEGENPRLDYGLAFRANLPYESGPNWPLPLLMQRTQQCQQPSPMVNVSEATSTSPVLNFAMEPPSNQSYCGNYTPLWPEEEKMVGMKRPYPFSLENPTGPPFHCKFPAIIHPISRSDESASCGNGGSFNFEPGNPIREGPSCSTSMSDTNSKKGSKENGAFNGDFLTLAPPASSSPFPSSKFKHPPACFTSHNHEFSECESLPDQGIAEDPICQPGAGGSIQPPPFYSFLPPAKSQIGQAATHIYNFKGEEGESVDLNLKL